MSKNLPTLWKVLGPNGDAVHGGSGSWPLPTTDGPGEWMRVSDALRLCSTGLHLTDKPMLWWKPEARLFEVEVAPDAETVGSLDDGDHKIAVNAARLLREDDWSNHNVWSEGDHTVSEGFARAYGSAMVTAYDSATVTAYGSAMVTAYDSARVTAYDSTTVTASDSTTVTASDSTTVTASGSATVTAYDSTTVTASGSARVTAYDSATVKAYDSATVISTIHHFRSATVTLAQKAAHVDRRGDAVELRKAEA